MVCLVVVVVVVVVEVVVNLRVCVCVCVCVYVFHDRGKSITWLSPDVSIREKVLPVSYVMVSLIFSYPIIPWPRYTLHIHTYTHTHTHSDGAEGGGAAAAGGRGGGKRDTFEAQFQVIYLGLCFLDG
jgi:hypothetical protein